MNAADSLNTDIEAACAALDRPRRQPQFAVASNRFHVRKGEEKRERRGIKALIRQDNTVSRCHLRGGVHLEQGYVNDVCLTPRFNQCVFYEDELTRE